MFLEEKKYFFKKARVLFDDDEAVEIDKKSEYSKIAILSYNKLDLTKNYRIREKVTSNIDCTGGIEKTFNLFNKTARNEINKTFRNEDLVFKILKTDKEKEYAHKMYEKFERKLGRVSYPLKSFQGCLFFAALYKNEFVSLIICLNAFPYLRARSIASLRFNVKENKDTELYKIISNSSRRLVYEICKYASENGYIHFDLGSINIKDKEKQNLYNFKSKFGGKIEPEYTYIWKSFFYTQFERFVFFRLCFARFIKKFIK